VPETQINTHQFAPRHHQLGQLDPFQVQPTASKGEWFRVQLTVGKLKSAFTFNR